MRITLNLATRPFTDIGPILKQLRVVMVALALLAALFGFGLYHLHAKAVEARASEHAVDQQIARIAAEQQGYEQMMQQPGNALLLRQTKLLNALFANKAFSWTLAMESLEKVLPEGVSAATLEPIRDKNGLTTLHMRVVGPRDRAVELVRNLEHSQRFHSPRIIGENAESDKNGSTHQLEPISASNRFTFDILADYNPPTADEHRFAASGKPDPGTVKTTSKPDTATLPALHAVKPASPQDKPHPGGAR
jgi:type IV pilus assembly protein PilN